MKKNANCQRPNLQQAKSKECKPNAEGHKANSKGRWQWHYLAVKKL